MGARPGLCSANGSTSLTPSSHSDFTQGVTPLHQDADRYLRDMGFEDVMERAVSSDAQTPPLATNPLSYLAM